MGDVYSLVFSAVRSHVDRYLIGSQPTDPSLGSMIRNGRPSGAPSINFLDSNGKEYTFHLPEYSSNTPNTVYGQLCGKFRRLK